MARRLAASAGLTLGPGNGHPDERPEVLPLARLRRPIQSAWHLKRILEVCKQTPDTKHWLPTREAQPAGPYGPGRITKEFNYQIISNQSKRRASELLAVDVVL